MNLRIYAICNIVLLMLLRVSYVLWAYLVLKQDW